MKKWLLLACFLLLILTGCGKQNSAEGGTDPNQNNPMKTEKSEILVSAAASMTDAMSELKEIYEAENHDTELTFNFAGSGKLAQQIQQGAPVDVFISANEKWMSALIEDGYIDEDDRRDITGNRLVIIAKKPTSLAFENFKDIDGEKLDQIAIGNPDSVPAGEYAKSTLKSLGKWDELTRNFVYAKDVRQVLTYVETGNTQIGFVYKTDALSSDNVEIITYSDPKTHGPIIYPGAILNTSKHREQASRFLDYMQSEAGQSILEKYGFVNK